MAKTKQERVSSGTGPDYSSMYVRKYGVRVFGSTKGLHYSRHLLKENVRHHSADPIACNINWSCGGYHQLPYGSDSMGVRTKLCDGLVIGPQNVTGHTKSLATAMPISMPGATNISKLGIGRKAPELAPTQYQSIAESA